MPVRHFRYDRPFALENGEQLPELTIAYHTYGKFRGDNAIWVCHALTANSDVADWWPRTVEQGRFLDPRRYYIVCANIIGSHYGSTGPLSTNPATGSPYYGSFPFITVRDMVRAHLLLADHLGIGSARAVIGSSIGGFQAMEMALARPGFARRLVLIATAARSQPWAIAFNESQRMAIEADDSYGRPDEEAGKKGMRVSRSVGLLSYRGRPTTPRSRRTTTCIKWPDSAPRPTSNTKATSSAAGSTPTPITGSRRLSTRTTWAVTGAASKAPSRRSVARRWS